MREERLSVSDLEIFRLVLAGEMASGRIARAIDRSPSYTSECIGRLVKMNILQTRRAGMTVLARPSSSPVAVSLALLVKEGSAIDARKVLTGPGLAILPHLVPPGMTARGLLAATRLSQMTVMERLRLWRGMGLVVREKGTGHYRLADGQRELAEFAASYSEDQDRRQLAEKVPGALIVWRGPGGYIFSVDAGTPVKGFAPAGPSALPAPFVSSRDYYQGGGPRRKVSLEEALVQALLIDPANPRIRRLVMEHAGADPSHRRRLAAFAEKYGIPMEAENLLEAGHGAD